MSGPYREFARLSERPFRSFCERLRDLVGKMFGCLFGHQWVVFRRWEWSEVFQGSDWYKTLYRDHLFGSDAQCSRCGLKSETFAAVGCVLRFERQNKASYPTALLGRFQAMGIWNLMLAVANGNRRKRDSVEYACDPTLQTDLDDVLTDDLKWVHNPKLFELGQGPS